MSVGLFLCHPLFNKGFMDCHKGECYIQLHLYAFILAKDIPAAAITKLKKKVNTHT